jgi:iron complex outermembrane receptor protein
MYMTPRNFGSLWNTYEFLAGDLRGLKFGAGVVAASQSQGDFANDYQIPGYATVNLLTSYALKVGKSKVTLQLNLDNLLDKTYYSGSNTAYQIAVGTPRTFLGSVKVEF